MADLPAKSDELRDPMEVILEEMRTNPDDAAILAQFLDVSVLVRIFREMQYGAEEKIRKLVEIAKTGTPSENMRAIKMLDEIWQTALVRRGMLMSRSTATAAGLPSNPLGMPQPLRSFEATQTTTSVRATMDALAGEVVDTPTQPLQEKTDHGQEEKSTEEDDAYFADDRGENANIFRPATADHGQRTEI